MAVLGLLSEVLECCVGDDVVVAGLRYLAGLGEPPLATQPGAEAVRVEVEEGVFALHQSYVTKPASQGRYEAHRRFIDLQYIVSGTELIRVAPFVEGMVTDRYDSETDLEFFRLGQGSDFLMKPGMVAVLYPEDLHAPCLAHEEPALVQKVVVKVRL